MKTCVQESSTHTNRLKEFILVLLVRCVSRVSREAALDVNTEPSQSEQIVWDDPTAREERAKLADNLQWPGSPSQHSDPLPPAPPPTEEASSQFRDSMTDSELVEIGKTCAFCSFI